jgi:two-component system, NarL family, sensor histidine kinase UhpB
VSAEPFEYWRLFITAGLAVLILVGAFVGSVIIQQRRYLAVTRSLSGRLLLAQEKERSSVARELHDGLIQRVVLLGSELSRMPPVAGPDANELAVWRDAFREELRDVADDIRRIAHGMHPSILDTLGLQAALASLADEFYFSDNLTVRFSAEAPLAETSPDVALTLYRVAQEGLRNVARHAGVSRAELRATPTPGGVMVEVMNELGAAPGGGARNGFGLKSVAERVRLLNGRFSFKSDEAGGTRLVVWVPTNG